MNTLNRVVLLVSFFVIASCGGGGGGGHGPATRQGGKLAEGILALIEAPREQKACSRSTSEMPRKVCLG